MAMIYRSGSGRLTVAEAKRLILDASPREKFVNIYRRPNGGLKAVEDNEPKSIYAGHLDQDVVASFEQVNVVPRWKYRPSQTGYAGDPNTDDLYTIDHEEFVRLAKLFDLTVEETSKTPMLTAQTTMAQEAWLELARIKAREIIQRQAKRDLYPSQEVVADEIAADFRKRSPPIVGADGKPLSGATIKRHALRGISSAIKKARSTSTYGGK